MTNTAPSGPAPDPSGGSPATPATPAAPAPPPGRPAGGGAVRLAAVFPGEGEMARRCRAFDWAATPLGPVTAWPAPLRTAVALCLDAAVPSFVWWGPDLVQVYNDAALAIVRAKHPAALGQPARVAWADVWPVVGPLFERVLTTGAPVRGDDVPMAPARDGPGDPGAAPAPALETAWFTFSYGPARDAAGAVAGVFCTALETTARVRAEAALRAGEARQAFLLALSDALRPLADPAAVEGTACRLLGEQVGAERAWYCEWREAEGYAAVAQDYARAGLPSVVGRYPLTVFDWTVPLYTAAAARGGAVVVDDVHTAPGIPDAAREATLAAALVAWIAVPLVKAGRLVGALNVGDARPRAWTDDEVAVVRATAERIGADVERARAEAALTASEARHRLIVEGARDYVICTADPAGRVTSWSPGAEAVLGWTADEIVGRDLAVTFTPEDRAAGAPEAERAEAAAHGVAPDVRWHQRKDGRRVFLEGTTRVLRDGADRDRADRDGATRDDGGALAGFLKVGQDVTERRRLDEALRASLAAAEAERRRAEDARADAEAANRAKSEFLAVMSHELRTPLNAIGGYTELLELGLHGPVTDAQRAALARIQASQRHLLGLIAGVLDYARVEAGAVTYRLADVSVGEAVAEAEALVAPQLRAKGLGYAWSGAPPGLRVRADREKLQQILLNLLGNAVKFTPPRDGVPGRVEVACTVAPAGAGAAPDDGGHPRVPEGRPQGGEGAVPGWVRLHVRDTGAGIAAAECERIFEPFVQADQRLTRRQEGVGLGLAISRDLARGMGGDLTVESTPDVGSTFTLILPAAT